jgi:hypothetical protein
MYALLKSCFTLIVLGGICGLIVLGTILIPSDGTEPREVCILVKGTQGILPINQNNGGSIVYSCDINWELALLYIAFFGFPLAMISMILIWFIMRTLVQRKRQ